MHDDDRHPDPHLVTVIETSDPDLVPIIRSILDGAGIPHTLDGESMVNLFPSEAMMPVMSRHGGELVVQVPADREEEARALLSQDFDPPSEADELEGDQTDDEEE